MCRSGTQVELPRRLAMSQVGLVDDHTLHQPCVQSLSFTSTLALWMPAHWTPSLWPTVAIPQRKKWHLPGGRITSGDLPLRTHTHKHAYYITRSEARFARLLLDCELSYCFHWVIVVVGGRVHEWCKKGSGIKGHIITVTSVYVARTCMWWWCACPRS